MTVPTLIELAYQVVNTDKVPLDHDVRNYIDRVKPRIEMRDTIFRLVRETEGYVYGGIVRDLIAGLPFNDVDIYFTSKDKFDAFIEKLPYIIIRNELIEGYRGSWLQRKISLCDREKPNDRPDYWRDLNRRIYLDVSYRKNSFEFDFDVNQLEIVFTPVKDCVEINGFYVTLHPDGEGSLKEIIRNIRRKRFIVLRHQRRCLIRDFGTYFYEKLLDRVNARIKKGWNLVSECSHCECHLSFKKGLQEYKSRAKELEIFIRANIGHLDTYSVATFKKGNSSLSTLKWFESLIRGKIAKRDAYFRDSLKRNFIAEISICIENNVRKYEKRVKSKKKSQQQCHRREVYRQEKLQDRTYPARNKLRLIRGTV